MLYKEANTLVDYLETLDLIKVLGNYYPNFNHWYWNKVIPRIEDNINTIIMGYNKNQLVGISIIKNSEDEKKLCALRVKDEFKNKGYGLHMIDKSLNLLNTDKPLCSVSSDMINDYSRIFINKYQFDLTYVYNGLYTKGKLEYEFNGNQKLKIESGY